MNPSPPGNPSRTDKAADARAGGQSDRLDEALRALAAALTDATLPEHARRALENARQALARAAGEIDRLRALAHGDALTGLPNRNALHDALGAMLAEPAAQAAVLYIDLDRFRRVNDALGHEGGDRLLAAAADRLRGAVGDAALIGRQGGDEFLILCRRDDDPDRPQRLARAVQAAFAEPFHLEGEAFVVAPSIGIALAPEHGRDAATLIRHADLAMYESKRAGHRRDWHLFEAALGERHRARLRLESELRRAIDKGEFRLVYQPQIALASGRLVGAEALIRWRNPALGEMRPDRFIDHLERADVMAGLGRWVLGEACRQVRAWRERGLTLPRIAVNVSSRQLLADDLVRHVRAALAESGLDGDVLELELTEHALVEDLPDTETAFAALRALGVTLTIDDFGEGYSALEYLRRLPIHGLKLSKLFVQGVPAAASDVAICRAVYGIAHHLGLDLVAEGIEQRSQLEFLRELGVRRGQGFLFAAGLSGDDFLDYARRLPA